jgi:uncharacterized protein YggE
MTDATPTHEDAAHQGAAPRPAQRRRLLAVGAVIAVAVALGGGVAAAVAAVVSRTSTPAASSNGASLYFPIAPNQQSQQAGVGSTAMNAGPAMPAMAQGGMGAPAADRAYSLSIGAGPAMTQSLAYPYPGGWCNAAPAPAATGPGITATGLAQVNLPGAPASAQTLNVGVQSDNNNSDLKTALADVEQRLAAIRTALHTAGVADDHITQQGLNIYGNGGGPNVTKFGVNAGLTATISDAAVLDRAVHAAANAGASSVNVWSNNAATSATPDDKTLQSAVAKATDAARSMAQSQAQAAGVSLGALQSSQVQPPSICGWTPTGAQMVVGVTLTYAIK